MSDSSAESKEKPTTSQFALNWSALGVAVLLLTLGHNPLRATLHGLQLSSQIVERSRSYQDQVRTNDAQEQENRYLRTESGKQWAVRRYTGMVKPGQTVGQTVEDAAAKSASQATGNPFWNWQTQFLAGATDWCRERMLVLKCYLGLRPPDPSPIDRNQKPAGLSKDGKKQSGHAGGPPSPETKSDPNEPSKQ